MMYGYFGRILRYPSVLPCSRMNIRSARRASDAWSATKIPHTSIHNNDV